MSKKYRVIWTVEEYDDDLENKPIDFPSVDHNLLPKGIRRLWERARNHFSSQSSVSTDTAGSCETPNACPCGYTDGCSFKGNLSHIPAECKKFTFDPRNVPDESYIGPVCYTCGYPRRIEPCPFRNEHSQLDTLYGRG